MAALIDEAVSEKLERIEAQKFGKVQKPRTVVEEADTSPGGRGIAAAVRRFVHERDERRCTFVSQGGRRCPVTHDLEYHHDDPRGRGGDRSPENIRLVCKSHNLFLAELDYGKEKMVPYRWDGDGSDQAREPLPGLELVPDRAGGGSAGLGLSPSTLAGHFHNIAFDALYLRTPSRLRPRGWIGRFRSGR